MNGVGILLYTKPTYVFGKFQTVQRVTQRVSLIYLPHYNCTWNT